MQAQQQVGQADAGSSRQQGDGTLPQQAPPLTRVVGGRQRGGLVSVDGVEPARNTRVNSELSAKPNNNPTGKQQLPASLEEVLDLLRHLARRVAVAPLPQQRPAARRAWQGIIQGQLSAQPVHYRHTPQVLT